jgi:hypothetical protein
MITKIFHSQKVWKISIQEKVSSIKNQIESMAANLNVKSRYMKIMSHK